MRAKFFAMSVLGVFIFAVSAPAAQRSGDPATSDRGSKEGHQYSDRDRSKAWNNEKEKLEQALKPGQDKNYYRQELEKMGYKVTAVNYDTADYVEYEIVKNGDSYEVQIDLKQGKASKIDVATNMWKAEATEKALKESGRGRSATKAAR
ncbi:MAG TPA: hypothetical protein VGB09_03370 [Candidatus Binatia bacterium]